MSLPSNPIVGTTYSKTITISNSTLKDQGILTGVGAGITGAAARKYVVKKIESELGKAAIKKSIWIALVATELAAFSGYVLDHFTDYDGIEITIKLKYQESTFCKQGVCHSWEEWSNPDVDIDVY
ncbi:hypothetical protein IZY60_14370 [Lutibacter sp. B2]|nr:hypothetical protein [Lutibacter sp. B2]